MSVCLHQLHLYVGHGFRVVAEHLCSIYELRDESAILTNSLQDGKGAEAPVSVIHATERRTVRQAVSVRQPGIPDSCDAGHGWTWMGLTASMAPYL